MRKDTRVDTSFLNSVAVRESVTLALLFTALMLFLGIGASTGIYAVFVMVGLGCVWLAVLMTGLSRL